MRPIEHLMNEHRNIERVLRCLLAAADEAERGNVDRDTFDRAVDFFRNYADRCHHGKEEAQLFPVLEKAGVPKDGGPIGVMLHEHVEGRGHVGAIADAAGLAAEGDADARARLVHHSRDFAALLSAHIEKEDNVLFQMAESVLEEATVSKLESDFDAFDENDFGRAEIDRLLGIADDLCERWNVTPDTAS